MKQFFMILIQSFDKKIGMKNKTLLKRFEQVKSRIGGLNQESRTV